MIFSRNLLLVVGLVSSVGAWAESFFPPSEVPATAAHTDSQSVELGMQFQVTQSGTIRSVRFYKGSGNGGTHIANLWNSSGQNLARATFQSETATGWQTVNFATPVSVTTGQTYTVSYFAPQGRYAITRSYFSGNITRGSLTALAANGVYRYAASTAFPSSSYGATNYWVDVDFQAASAPAPVTISLSPSTSSLAANQSTQFTATVTGSSNTSVTWTLNPAVGSISASGLYTAPSSISSSQTITVRATSAADTSKVATASVTLNPSAPVVNISLSPSTVSLLQGQSQQFSASVTGSSNTSVNWSLSPQVGTLSASGLYTAPATVSSPQTVVVTATSAADSSKSASASISLAGPPSGCCSFFTTSDIPAILSQADTQSVELGVKFQVAQAGTISALKFYKGSANTGIHVGSLWTAAGQLLGRVTFSGETATGWQTATLSSPVAVQAGQTYVASYFAPSGGYSVTRDYFGGGNLTRGSITLLGDGSSGGNGLYSYVGTPSFPTSSYSGSNYFVDVVFAAGSGSGSGVQISVTPPTANLTDGQQVQFTASVTGTGNTGVTWQLTPNVGTITASGYYFAPATISSQQTITVRVTSNADASKSATAILTLNSATAPPPAISVTVNPPSATVATSQSAQFTASVSNTSNTGVTWSLSPAVGSISSSGLYTAPSSLASQTAVTVRATSVADTSKSATATVTVQASTTPPPTGNLSILPSTGSSSAGVAADFTVSNNTANAVVTEVLFQDQSLSSPTPAGSCYVQLQHGGGSYLAGDDGSMMVDQSVWIGQSWSRSPQNSQCKFNGPTSRVIAGGTPYQIGLNLTFLSSWNGKQLKAFVRSTTSSNGSWIQGTWSQVGTWGVGGSAPPPAVTISLNPPAASLNASQQQQFTASVTGTSNTGVTWTLSPQVGSLSASGLYTSPGSVTSTQTVTVRATSVADTSKSAIATVTLNAGVAISLNPPASSLNQSQSQQFTASVTGTSNTGVTWALTPQVGSISNGNYTAPSSITSQQTVTVRCTSVADTSKVATATVTLVPPTPTVNVTVNPSSLTLTQALTQQFTASVTGTSNTAVTWSITPSLGTISASGLYLAPLSILTQGTVTVRATSVADTSKFGTATISLNPPASSGGSITVPVEVMGTTTTTVPVNVTLSGSIPSSGNVLWMKAHGIRYDNQVSIQVNNSSWVNLTNSSVAFEGSGLSFGGFGGGFSTLKFTVPVPAGALVTGANTVRFRFNGTDGRTSGFRVLDFNLKTSAGASLIPASTFVYDNPANWQAPLTSAADIAEGQRLWSQANLSAPGMGNIQAKCASCHAQDGRDLKYFNYSNFTIRTRSMFHGLTAQQGDQIASYIRRLNIPAPGTPWDPPYQPGPGLDSKPVTDWAAGAGLNAVLDSDNAMIDYLAPGRNTSNWAPSGDLNIRELPVPIQLPDWNGWLPGVHPIDAFSDFTGSQSMGHYNNLRRTLQPGNASIYQGVVEELKLWGAHHADYKIAKRNAIGDNWTQALRVQLYSLMQWKAVKEWELNQEFGLEGLNQAVFGPQGEPRGWFSTVLFATSPNMVQTGSGPGIGNGSNAVFTYLAFAWYHTQLILNDGNKQHDGTTPVDWPYVYGFFKDLGNASGVKMPTFHMAWLVRAMQVQENGKGPEYAQAGWSYQVNAIDLLAHPAWQDIWARWSAADRQAFKDVYIRNWLSRATSFTPQQWRSYWTSGSLTATANPDGNFADRMWYAIPVLRHEGYSSTLIDSMVNFSKAVWPNNNWDARRNVACSGSAMDGSIRCN